MHPLNTKVPSPGEKANADTQDACCRGMSYLHSTEDSARGSGKKVFVAYFDVAKAFNTVWTEKSLFSRIICV